MQENVFNKTTTKGRGTLIGNWQEENALRDATGIGRTIPKEHIPKRHGDLENPIIPHKEFDNTAERIQGYRRDEVSHSENWEYGRSINPAESIPKVGRRTQILEHQIQQEIAKELAERDARDDKRRQERYFDTTTGSTFIQQDMTANTIGRRLIKTQDGAPIAPTQFDEELAVEKGFNERKPLMSEQELKASVPKGGYAQQQPVTFYTEHLSRKNVYMSSTQGVNPFAKSHAFTQPLDKTRGADKFEGNISRDMADTKVKNFYLGHDLGIENPHMKLVTEDEMRNFREIRQQVIDLARKRSGNGIAGLRVMFRAMDRNRNKTLDPVEFKYAMRDYGLDLTQKEIDAILKHFDTNRDGKISFDEFLRAVRGELNPHRLKFVKMAYAKLDKNGDGTVTLADLRDTYDVSFHPDFGRKSKDEILKEFMQVWEKHQIDAIVTPAEFEDYYKDISASIDRDDYFELMIRNAWHIAGGQGWAANTTNKRVLQEDEHGNQSIVTIQDDLGARGGQNEFARMDY